MITPQQKIAVNELKQKHSFRENFKWWVLKSNNELFLRLDDHTVFGVHPSGLITKHSNKVEVTA
jgi:hypothetical protein